jgi:hypothetical protein
MIRRVHSESENQRNSIDLLCLMKQIEDSVSKRGNSASCYTFYYKYFFTQLKDLIFFNLCLNMYNIYEYFFIGLSDVYTNKINSEAFSPPANCTD